MVGGGGTLGPEVATRVPFTLPPVVDACTNPARAPRRGTRLVRVVHLADVVSKLEPPVVAVQPALLPLQRRLARDAKGSDATVLVQHRGSPIWFKDE